MGTAITLLIVGGMVSVAVRSIVRDARSGSTKCSGCKSGCANAGCKACDIKVDIAQ